MHKSLCLVVVLLLLLKHSWLSPRIFELAPDQQGDKAEDRRIAMGKQWVPVKLSWHSGKPCFHLSSSKKELVAMKKQTRGRSPAQCDEVAEPSCGQTWMNQVHLPQTSARGVESGLCREVCGEANPPHKHTHENAEWSLYQKNKGTLEKGG